MHDWTVTLETEPYAVAEHDRSAFASAVGRLEAELGANDQVLGAVAASPREGAFSAVFSVRAESAGKAADRGCELFLLALEEALHPLRFPIATHHPAANGIGEPVIAAVTARSSLYEAAVGRPTGGPVAAAGLAGEDGAAASVEINGYAVPQGVARALAAHLRTLPGEWNGPAAKCAMRIEMTLTEGAERGVYVEGSEREAMCDALQGWIRESMADAEAEQLIALMQGLSRDATEQQPA